MLLLSALFFMPRPADAQYTPQVLMAPASLPSTTPTEGFAMNERGQVYGAARPTPTTRVPLLWTNGTPSVLTIPDGYQYDGHGGEQFVNNSGTAITNIASAANIPGGVLNQILRWNNGGAPDFVPLPPPSTMVSPACSATYVHSYPLGLNNLGHVLMLMTDATGACPWVVWLWDGNGPSPDHFREITPVTGDATGCSSYVMRFDGQHLNDQDHIAIEFGGASPSCAQPMDLTAGTLDNGTYTPRITLLTAGSCTFCAATGIGGINNHDQLLAWVGDVNNPDLLLWNGAAIVDLGLERDVHMNNLGHVFYVAVEPPSKTVRLYKNGAASDVPLPTQIPGFVLTTDMPTPLDINSTGQLLVSMNFNETSVVDRAVILNPTPPTLTLKINGQHPTPPLVSTTGPMQLTIDLTASAYTGTLTWYWGVLVNNQLLWVTSTGLSATPGPLAVAAPSAIANATLLNTTLSPGTTVVSFFLLVDGGGAVVASDVVGASRT